MLKNKRLKAALGIMLLSSFFGATAMAAPVYKNAISCDAKIDKKEFAVTVSEGGKKLVYEIEDGTKFELTEYAVSVPVKKDVTLNIGNGTGTMSIDCVNEDSKMTGISYAGGIYTTDSDTLVINGNVDIKAWANSYSACGLCTCREGTGQGSTSRIDMNGNLFIGDRNNLNPTLDSSSKDAGWGINVTNVHGGDGFNLHYTGSRWHPCGVTVGMSGGSVINLNKDVFIAIRGCGLNTDPYYVTEGMHDYDTAIINANKGNVTIITPKSKTHSYYAIANYGGTINVNMAGKTVPGSNVVNLKGNLFTIGISNRPNENYPKNEETGMPDSGLPYFYRAGRTNLALTTSNSLWEGIVDNCGVNFLGETNIWLQNGATWNHVDYSKADGMSAGNMPSPSNEDHYGKYDESSHITRFVGGTSKETAGFVMMNSPAEFRLDNYSGHTRFYFSHSNAGTSVKDYSVGSVRITHAEKGSEITLVTDNSGINMTDEKVVKKSLNTLAKKVWYYNYRAENGSEDNLKGFVQIAEGLTTSSASLKYGEIVFNDRGKGGCNEVKDGGFVPEPIPAPEPKPNPDPDPNPNPDPDPDPHPNPDPNPNPDPDPDPHPNPDPDKPGDKDLEFTTSLTGDGDQEFIDSDVVHEGNHYIFNTNITINPGTGSSISVEKDLDIEATANTVTLEKGIVSGGSDLRIDAEKIEINNDNEDSVKWSAGKMIIYANTEINVNKGQAEKHKISSIYIDGGQIYLNVKEKANDEIAVVDKTLKITGNIEVNSNSNAEINLGFNNRRSFLKGLILAVKNKITDRSSLYRSAVKNEINVSLNGAEWTNMSVGKTAEDYSGSRVSTLIGGKGANRGIVIQKDKKDININNLKGDVLFFYDHDEKLPENIIGGDVRLVKGSSDSLITLRTDGKGIVFEDSKEAKAKIESVLSSLAGKLVYGEAENETENKAQNEASKNTKMMLLKTDEAGTPKVEVEIVKAEGLTTPGAEVHAKADIRKKDDGSYEVVRDSNVIYEEGWQDIYKNPEVLYGPEETAMMRGAKSAMTTSLLNVRNNMTTMYERFGDTRYDETKNGVWARAVSGKLSYDKDGVDIDNSYSGAEVGTDFMMTNGWRVGVGVDYTSGTAHYENGGKGDPKMYMASLYASKLSEDGHYLDAMLKVGRAENEFTVYNDNGFKLKGDYNTNVCGVSLAYGKRFIRGNSYFEPQLQLTAGRITGTDYDAHSDFMDKDMHVSQKGMTSKVVRAGVSAGRSNASGDLYANLSVLHEFDGLTSSTFEAEGEKTGIVEQDFGDTWAELTVGANYRLSNATTVYGSVVKSFGGDYGVEWKVDAGLRFSF